MAHGPVFSEIFLRYFLQNNPRDLQKAKMEIMEQWKFMTDRIKEFTYIFANFGQIFML